MIAAEIIEALEKRGAGICIKDGAVKLRNPGTVPSELRAAARGRRDEIAALITANAGSHPCNSGAFWKAAYDDVEMWSPALQSAFVDRTDALEADGQDRDTAEARGYLDLREAARVPSPACFLRERFGIGIDDFLLLCRRTIGRVAPNSSDQDACVAAEILRVYRRTGR